MTPESQRLVRDSFARVAPIAPTIQALGQRHAGYGVADKDYATAAEALLWTLGQGLGDAFTPKTRAAWVEAHTILAGVIGLSLIGGEYEPQAILVTAIGAGLGPAAYRLATRRAAT